jgi:hypothetical protein
MALALPCIAISACYTAMLRRQLKFRQLATRSVFAYSAGASPRWQWQPSVTASTAWLASSGVAPPERGAIIAVSGLRPGMQVTRAALADIVAFGKHRVAHQVVAYTSLQSDRF